MKIAIAEVKRRLPVGTEFTAEFLREPLVVRGNCGDTVMAPVQMITRRRVVKQTSQMVSVYLDGPKAGKEIYCDWAGVSAREDTDGSIILTNTKVSPAEDFLRIRKG
jgi:hypothetical protein